MLHPRLEMNVQVAPTVIVVDGGLVPMTFLLIVRYRSRGFFELPGAISKVPVSLFVGYRYRRIFARDGGRTSSRDGRGRHRIPRNARQRIVGPPKSRST